MRTDVAWAVGLMVAVVLAAALVNRFVPARRVRVRQVFILFVVFLSTLGLQLGFEAAGLAGWSERALVLSEIFRAFTLVSLGAMLVFSLMVPLSGVALPMIAADLVVGIGYIAATLAVLSGHGLNPTGALASAAVVSAVLAISLQSTLGNILGGVALQLDGSVHEGDWIELADGKQGRVRAIRWRHTVLETRDYSTIIVPNATLLANNILLLGKRDGEDAPQRITVLFNVDFRHAPAQVVDIVGNAFAKADIEGVAATPRPSCVCLDLAKADSSGFASYQLRYWLLDMAKVEPTSSRVRARIYTALQRAGIPLAVPASSIQVEMDDEERSTRRRLTRRLGALRDVALFRTMTEEELGKLAAGLKPALYTADEVITRQGAVAHWLYILTKGAVEIRANIERGGSTHSKIIATVTAPSVFGEMGLMTGEARSADVVAVGDVECYRLDKNTFETVISARPEMVHALSQQLAERRVELEASREGLDGPRSRAMVEGERDKILSAIKSFFGL